MPFVHIRSLPFENPVDIPMVLRKIAEDFSGDNDVPLFHVHVTWEFYQPGCYAKGGETPEFHPESRHPVIVDLLTPDFNTLDVVEKMLNSLAPSISRRAGVNQNNIFINHRYANSGMVYDDGKIVWW